MTQKLSVLAQKLSPKYEILLRDYKFVPMNNINFDLILKFTSKIFS